MDIVALFQCLQPHVTTTTLRQCSRIAWAMLVMTGRVTMLGISRWAGQGGSYRTVQRFFATVIPWATLFWMFFRQHIYRPGDVYLLVGDEVVATKAGKHTYGLDRFFCQSVSGASDPSTRLVSVNISPQSSRGTPIIAQTTPSGSGAAIGKPVPGLAFFTLSLVSIAQRHSFPIRVEQVVRSDAEKAASKAKAQAKQPLVPRPKRRPGRPPGRTNQTKTPVTLTPELVRIQAMIDALLRLIMPICPLTYLVLDGHFGHHNALHMARQCALHLISKLRCDAALYLPHTGPYAGRGPHRKYGRKIDYDNHPVQYLKETTVEGHIQTCLYQVQLLHKEFTQPLNVVLIAKTNLRTQARAHVVLFSSDLALAYAPLVDYYSLQFQNELNFRDAKQYWGLEDFMNLTPTGVTNEANLALFMVNVSYRLRADVRQHYPDYSILDLKADCRGSKYVEETIKMLPEKPEPVLLAKIRHKVAGLGRIHALQPRFSFS